MSDLSKPLRPPLKNGDIVSYTSPEVIKRKWWQFWKERHYYSGRMVTERYVVISGPFYAGSAIGACVMEKVDDS